VDNIKIDLRETGWDGMDWIDLAQDRDQWRAQFAASQEGLSFIGKKDRRVARDTVEPIAAGCYCIIMTPLTYSIHSNV
jgi:hypothetical protein